MPEQNSPGAGGTPPQTPEPKGDAQGTQETPGKFQGKPVEEVIKSYQEIERTVGQMKNDLGQLRQENATLRDALAKQPEESSDSRSPKDLYEEGDVLGAVEKQIGPLKEFVERAKMQEELRGKIESARAKFGDFNDFVPEMESLAKEAPELASSPEALYWAAKGRKGESGGTKASASIQAGSEGPVAAQDSGSQEEYQKAFLEAKRTGNWKQVIAMRGIKAPLGNV